MKKLQLDMTTNPRIRLMMNKIILVNAAIMDYRQPPTSAIVNFELRKGNKLTVTCVTKDGYHFFSAIMLSENNMDSTSLIIGNKKEQNTLRDTQLKGINRAHPPIVVQINAGMASAYALLLNA